MDAVHGDVRVRSWLASFWLPAFLCGFVLLLLLLTLPTVAAPPQAPLSLLPEDIQPQAALTWGAFASPAAAGNFWDVAIADLNHDGRADLVASLLTTGLRAWRGDDAGHWTASSSGLPVVGAYRRLALADINQDGHLDLVAATVGNGIRVYLGDGNGAWSAGASPTASGAFTDVAVGDLNGDGRLDLVGARGDDAGLQAWLRTSNELWSASASGLPTSGAFQAVALADADHDGKLEIAASQAEHGLRFYERNSATGVWSPASTGLPTTGTFVGVGWGDLEGDGSLELLAAGQGVGLRLWRSLGPLLGWGAVGRGLPTSGSFRSIAAADLNRDGQLDLAATTATGGIRAWIGNGRDDFFPASQGLPQSDAFAGLALGDLNADGQPDLAAAGSNGAGLSLWRNARTPTPWLGWSSGADPGGNWDDFVLLPQTIVAVGVTTPCVGLFVEKGLTWTAQTERPCADQGLVTVAVGDLNNDGQVDIVAATVSGGLRAWLNATGWTRYDSGLPTTGTYRRLALGDFNLDGDLDLVAATDGSGVRAWRGDGAGHWSEVSTGLPNYGEWWDVALGDVVLDGVPEIVATSQDNLGVRMWGFSPPMSRWQEVGTPWLSSYYGLALGDINRDGKLDIAAAASFLGDVGVYYGDGVGVLTATSPYITPTIAYMRDVALGDINGDGDLDLAAIGEDPVHQLGSLIVWFGDGGHTWRSAVSYGTDGTRVALGHLNDDGQLDMVALDSAHHLQTWLAGDFSVPVWPVPYFPSDWVNSQTVTCSASVYDSLSGLDISSARYSYSRDGGATWSDWLTATCTGADGTTGTQTVSSPPVPFARDSGTTNPHRIRFLIRDRQGNWGLSPEREVAIDSTPPTAPSGLASPGHTTNLWSKDNTVRVTWAPASDASSGVDGYAVVWDHASSTLPGGALTTHGADYTSPPLADAADWWVHVRSVDHAGNWSAAAAHLGPFKIDTVAPPPPGGLTSSSHTVGQWSHDPYVDAAWAAATDASSGVSGYGYSWTHDPTAIPDPTLDTSGTSVTSSRLSDAADWYLHVRTVDLAGNWSATAAHLGPFKIDATPPSNPTVTSSHLTNDWLPNRNITMNYPGAADALSGLAGWSYVFNNSPYSIPPTNVLVTGTTGLFHDLADGKWYFHFRAKDNAGNWSTTLHAGFYGVDATPPAAPVFVSVSPWPNEWTNDNRIYAWWVANDGAGSGAGHYSLEWNHSSIFVPDTTWDQATNEVTSASLADGDWYLHVRALDGAAQWGPASSVGPFKVDATAPTLPDALRSSSHTVNVQSRNNQVAVSWSAASEARSGLDGYATSWCHNDPNCTPERDADTTLTQLTSAPLSDGNWWFAVLALDRAGNASTVRRIGPFIVAAPYLQLSLQADVQHPAPGQRVNYVMNLANTGSGSAINARTVVTLSSNLIYKGCSGSCTHDHGVVRWDPVVLSHDEAVDRSLMVEVASSARQGEALLVQALLWADYTPSAQAALADSVQIPECPVCSLRLFDAAPNETVYVAMPQPGRLPHGQYGTLLQVQVRLSTPNVAASRYVVITLTVPDDALDAPTDVMARRSSGDHETELAWEDAGAGRYRTTVDLLASGSDPNYLRQVLFYFEVNEYVDAQTLRIQAAVDQSGRNCFSGQATASIVDGVDAVVITNRHHLYAYFVEADVDALLAQAFAEVNGQGAHPTGAVYYLDAYDDDIIAWNNQAIDWSSGDTVNDIADGEVNQAISEWYRDAARCDYPWPSDVVNPARYLVILGDDQIVPYYRAPDPTGDEGDNPDGPNAVITETRRHNYFFADAFYGAPRWNIRAPANWREGDSVWSVSRIVGATAQDMKTLLVNGGQGPSARSNTLIAASYVGYDLTGEYPALQVVRDWGWTILNDGASYSTIENDHWSMQTLTGLMQGDFAGFYYGGHSEYYGITAPHGNPDTLYAWDIPGVCGSFASDRPFFVLGGCRAGTSYSPNGSWGDSMMYALAYNGMSAAIAAGGISYGDGWYGWDDTAEELVQLVMVEMFDDGSPAPIGEALRTARRRYDEGLTWEDEDYKTLQEFMAFGLPWVTAPPASSSAQQLAALETVSAGEDAADLAVETSAEPLYMITVTATFDASRYSVDRASRPGWDLLRVDGFGLLREMYRPVLPMRHISLTLPQGAQVIAAQASVASPIVLQNLDIPMRVPYIPSSTLAMTQLTTTADALGTWPTRTVVSRVKSMGEYSVGHIWVLPARYDPLNNRAQLFRQVQITVTYAFTEPLAIARLASPPVVAPAQTFSATAAVANGLGITVTARPALAIVDERNVRVGYVVGDPVTFSPRSMRRISLTWTRPLTEGRYALVWSMLREGQVLARRTNRLRVRGGELGPLSGPSSLAANQTGVFTVTLYNHLSYAAPVRLTLAASNPADGRLAPLGAITLTLEGGAQRALRLPWRMPAGWRSAELSARMELAGQSYATAPLALRAPAGGLFLPLVVKRR